MFDLRTESYHGNANRVWRQQQISGTLRIISHHYHEPRIRTKVEGT